MTDQSPRTVRFGSPAQAVDTMRRQFDEPIADMRITAGPAVALARHFTMQARDRRGAIWGGRWLARFFVTPSLAGNPDATGNTIAFTTGQVWRTVIANAAYEVLTEVDGSFEFDLTLSGAGSRVIYLECSGSRFRDSAVFTF